MSTSSYAERPGPAVPSVISRLWRRDLDRFPGAGQRYLSLGIVVVTTIILYYELYLAGGVATSILSGLSMSFLYFVSLTAIANFVGALASVLAGLSDRYGRANIVTVGLLITGLLSLVAIPMTHSALNFAIILAGIGFVEGIMLVATPALIRDFSPQLGRASAMGFWTLGPVVGSLVVAVVVSSTTNHLAAWEDQYTICGAVGLGAFVLALFGLRELSPRLRDQLMVSHRDRALIEARAKGLEVADLLKKPFKQLMHADVVGSAVAISLFLLIYFMSVAYLPVYLETIFGYSQSKANGLGNWFWAFDAGALIVVGYASDKLRVRKPFMVFGALGAIAFTTLFALVGNDPSTSYTTLKILFILIAIFLAFGFAPWMASFTETVERHNPALTATGLAIWGLVLRIIAAIILVVAPFLVTTVSTLVDQAPKVQAFVGATNPNTGKPYVVPSTGKPYPHPERFQTLTTLSAKNPQAAAALTANPNNPKAQASAIATLAGVPTKTAALVLKDKTQLQTAQALKPQTQAALFTNPNDPATQAKAVGEIASGLGISQAQAVSRLQALAAVKPDLLYLAQHRAQVPKVAKGAAALQATAKIPPKDKAFFAKYAPKVQQAAATSPSQWSHYFWIGVGGEVVFIPLVFLMAGRWDPRKAKRDEEEHETMVEEEMTKLNA
jgi:MFS family permease